MRGITMPKHPILKLTSKNIDFIYFLNKKRFKDIYNSSKLDPRAVKVFETALNHPPHGDINSEISSPKKIEVHDNDFEGKEVYVVFAHASFAEPVGDNYLAIGYSTSAVFEYDAGKYSDVQEQANQQKATILSPALNFLSLLRADILATNSLFPAVIDFESNLMLVSNTNKSEKK